MFESLVHCDDDDGVQQRIEQLGGYLVRVMRKRGAQYDAPGVCTYTRDCSSTLGSLKVSDERRGRGGGEKGHGGGVGTKELYDNTTLAFPSLQHLDVCPTPTQNPHVP